MALYLSGVSGICNGGAGKMIPEENVKMQNQKSIIPLLY